MTELKIQDLSFSYRNKTVLDKISLTVDEPGLTCLLGPNGVGKTTLAKCIDGLLRYHSGSITLDGMEISSMSQAEIARKIAFIPNSSFSTFSITVSEAVMMGRFPVSGWSPNDEDLDAVEQAISLMNLEEFADRDIRELSAGQRQRVMIARGIVQEPEILILDEPTSNLDVKYQMEVMSFLHNLSRAKNITVLAVCHDLNVTAAYADRICLMSQGRVLADGSPNCVLTIENIREAYHVDAQIHNVNGNIHIAMVPPKISRPISVRKNPYRSADGIAALKRNDRRFAALFIVVTLLLGSILIAINLSDSSDSSLLGHTVSGSEIPSESSRLWVYGNANEDDRLDSDDVTYLQGVLGGTEKPTPLCDANLDGKVNSDDVSYLKRILAAQENGTDVINVYYIDDYRQNQKVTWPVKTVAIGYCTGAYMALITGVSSKVVAVDSTIRTTGWNDLSTYFSSAELYGTVEVGESAYEKLISMNIDVYVPGYFNSTIDPVTRERLSPFGIDTMVLTTADQTNVRNDYIDRTTTMFGYLLQGDMSRVYSYLNWHDSVLEQIETATASITDKQAIIEVHLSSDQTISEAGTYTTCGKGQTNNLHIETAGGSAAGMISKYLSANYASLNEETTREVMRECAVNGQIWYVFNAQDGYRQSVQLSKLADDKYKFSDAPAAVNYLGLAREAGSTGMYVVEIAFYQNVLYGTGPDYHALFNNFVNNFLNDGTGSATAGIEHFFKVY